MTPDFKVFGGADRQTLTQMQNCTKPDVTHSGALMADNHLGYSMPIGGVIAYRDHVSPSGVGYDIACGNKAVRTDLRYEDIADDLPGLMDRIFTEVSFGIGRTNQDDDVADHPLFDPNHHDAWSIPNVWKLRQKAQAQLGTVGSGNHYVDLFREKDDPDSPVWVGVHFGSRGFGHTIASGYMSLAKGGRFDERIRGEGMMDEPILIPTQSELGQQYLAAMSLAGEYAYAGRDYVVDKVLEILGAESDLQVHNHHNYAWQERHQADDVWVVRKGATPAFNGQWGFIGGSMGDNAYIIQGHDSKDSAASLYSTVHGAGRAMSRTAAAGKVKRSSRYQCSDRDCEWSVPAREYQIGRTKCPDHPDGRFRKIRTEQRVTQGAIDWPATLTDLDTRGITLRGGGADEAPGAYKRIDAVLAEHGDTIKIRHILTPIGVAMAGHDVYDPFKD